MDKKLSVLNLFLIFTAGTLVVMILKVWSDPASQARIEASPASSVPKSLPTLSAKRQAYPASIVSRITGKNLFRKERVEFKVEQPVVVAAASMPALPPPELSVRGLLLLAGTRIAVLEGSYSVHNDGTSVEKKAIKKKGYRVGDYIGDYQITAIEQNAVILSNKYGNQLIVELKKRGSPTPINRTGNRLFYKPPKPGSAPAAVPARPAVTRPAPTPHISGNPQPATAPPPAVISGARTAPRQTRPHISGR